MSHDDYFALYCDGGKPRVSVIETATLSNGDVIELVQDFRDGTFGVRTVEGTTWYQDRRIADELWQAVIESSHEDVASNEADASFDWTTLAGDDTW